MNLSVTRLLLIIIAFFASSPAVKAQSGGNSSVASLISEEKVIAPGKPFTVALKLDHPQDWHSYYQNSGGVELPPAIKWTLPEGFTAGPIQWPVPEVKDGFFGKSFVYTGSPVFLVDITAPTSLATGGSRHPHRRCHLADLRGKLHQRNRNPSP